MADNFKIEDVIPETLDTRTTYTKEEEKIEIVSMPTIQLPNYDYGRSQEQLDYDTQLRNKPTTVTSKYCIAYKSTNTTVTNSGTQIILDTYDTNDSGMNSSGTITITEDGIYSINSCVLAGTASGAVYSMVIEKNGSQFAKQSIVGSGTFSGIALECNAIANLVIGDILLLKYYASLASTTANSGYNGQRLCVSKL